MTGGFFAWWMTFEQVAPAASAAGAIVEEIRAGLDLIGDGREDEVGHELEGVAGLGSISGSGNLAHEGAEGFGFGEGGGLVAEFAGRWWQGKTNCSGARR